MCFHIITLLKKIMFIVTNKNTLHYFNAIQTNIPSDYSVSFCTICYVSHMNIVTCRVVRATKMTVLVRMIGFISTLVTISLNHI
jgi:hypothetical protein